MNDYKELIEALRIDEMLDAAKAIEQLVKERDNARRTLDQTLVRLNDETVRAERLEAENRAKEQYIAETISKVIRERDAAIADFETFAKTALDNPFACNFCKHEAGEHCKWKKQNRFDKDGCFGRYFEWRGVQEVAK